MTRKYQSRYIQYYTGSAAPKLLPQLPARKKSALPKQVKKPSYTIRLDPLAMAGIAVSAIMLVLMLVGFGQLQEAKQELALATSYVNTLQQAHQDLADTYEAGFDLDMIESAARGLGMTPVDEARHITVSVPKPEAEAQPLWERFSNFLVGLFA